MNNVIIFLKEEIDAAIDKICELESRLSDINVSIRTLETITSNYNRNRDFTGDFFSSRAGADSYESGQIESMTTSLDSLRREREETINAIDSCKARCERLKTLCEEASVADAYDSDDELNTVKGFDEYVESFNSLYSSFNKMINDDIISGLEAVKESEITYSNFANIDPTRVAIESQQNIRSIEQLIEKCKAFVVKADKYNVNETFYSNFTGLLKSFGCQLSDDFFEYVDSDDYMESLSEDFYLKFYDVIQALLKRDVSRETLCVSLNVLKTRVRLIFQVNEDLCDFSELIGRRDELDDLMLRYYMDRCGAAIRTKNSKGVSRIEFSWVK